jgi:DNA repair exonuclease SbcCD ATPase subunit
MVVSLGVLSFLSHGLAAQETPAEPFVMPPPPLPVITSSAVRVSSTNAVSATNEAVNVWKAFPGAVEAPGTHHLVTNASGAVVHQFNMTPVVTNLTVLTNALPEVAKKAAELDKEMKELPQRLNLLREAYLQDGKRLTNISTNFVPKDVEGQKIKARIEALEAELKPLREEIKKRLLLDPEYKKAKAKLDEDAAAFKALQDRRDKIREERGALSPQLYQINELRRRELSKRVQKDEPKTETKAVSP